VNDTGSPESGVAETGSAAPVGQLEDWHRLHPLTPLVRGGRALVVVVALAVTRLLGGRQDVSGEIVDGALVAIALIGGVVSWLVTRWRVEGGDLRIETGLIRRSSQRYPLRQLQAIDVVRSGVARMLGLAELRLRMAGGSSKGRLACLTDGEARALREQLLRLSAGPAGTAGGANSAGTSVPGGGVLERDMAGASGPASPAFETPALGPPILQVRNGLLAASLLLTLPGLIAVLYVAVIAGEVALHPSDIAGTVGGGLVVLLGLGSALARRYNGEYRLTVHQTPAGLQLSSGLVQTTQETLPIARVQALRMVEPLLWRPFGWCRVEAAVAGKTSRQEDRSQGNRRRALLPVGTYAQAHAVIALVLPDVAVFATQPPRRALWKVPLSYHRLSAGLNASCAVTTSGRLRRVSHWVPLEKVQSIRRTQGPIQRPLRLATVHLDTAGPRMRSALRDRDQVEAGHHLEALPAMCAAARARSTTMIPQPPPPRRRPSPR
jgi:putative membrane protein